ncbi:Rrf2 family transcriptional regulator [Streptococcus mutans]|uniref:Rrf2 family transcriptional regulator n=1 Tax=Streptococcus mutans TaxID=1309 RepID=UPI0002BE9C9A|nr:Rrf2 family transcriptional regulator [Streptococcus mutans]EMP69232.1 transcriptional regulator [Streptococcus mutans NCTC 11060]MCB5087449.1 Rrf2 family transcriptional regulator [Streptococcus mutans]
MDTKFSVALHILAMISESTEVLTSQRLATSVGTNASYIRKVIVLLKNAGLITSKQGKSGYRMTKAPEELTLLEIYYATQETDHIQLFQVHQHANKSCPVGKHITAAVSPIFGEVEEHLEHQLRQQTLTTVITNLYQKADTN